MNYWEKEVPIFRKENEKGAGRPRKYGVKTKSIRVPECMIDEIKSLIEKRFK